MVLTLLAWLLLSRQPASNSVDHFREIAVADVPAAVFDLGDWCDYLETAECRREFLRGGGAWTGDLDGDGIPELLVRGAVLGGTAGDPYWLFHRGRGGWEPLAANGGWLTITGAPRFDILPIVRSGHHDIRVGVTDCFKWDGAKYVAYDGADIHRLSPAWFDSSTLGEAELFWAIRYQGAKDAAFEPQWFPGVPGRGANVELADSTLGVRWVAQFKGGIYAVQSGRSFLLLPRPGYRGADRLEEFGQAMFNLNEFAYRQ